MAKIQAAFAIGMLLVHNGEAALEFELLSQVWQLLHKSLIACQLREGMGRKYGGHLFRAKALLSSAVWSVTFCKPAHLCLSWPPALMSKSNSACIRCDPLITCIPASCSICLKIPERLFAIIWLAKQQSVVQDKHHLQACIHPSTGIFVLAMY